MGDERRWAPRYQFLEQVWRGRDRIICDREIEAALHGSSEGALAELLGRLIPGEGGDARAWVGLHNERRAASFARARSGTVFLALDEAAEIAEDEDWQVLLVNLDDGPNEALDAVLEIAGERQEDAPARSVVLMLGAGSDEDQAYEDLADIVEQLFGDGRIYGLTRPTMAAFYDFGPVLEPEPAGVDESGGVVEARAEAAGIEVDNTLGSDEQRFEAFVAVVGSLLPGEGVTFVELPARTESRSAGAQATSQEAEDIAALRAQLVEAQRRGDMQAIERQALLEQLEQAEDRIASLDDALEAAGEGGAREEAQQFDELLAREQSLRWELERLRGEVENLRVRPVDDLEAELATVEAQLEQVQQALAEADSQDDAGNEDVDDGSVAYGAEAGADEPSAARVREWMKARAKLDHLLRRLERGGPLSALELHRELTGLRRLM